MAEANFRLPPPLKMSEDNLADNFRKWRRQLEVYMEVSSTVNKPSKTRTAVILHCAGPEALEVFDQLEFENEEDKEKPETVLEKFQLYCNEVLQRYRFWNLTLSTPFDKFSTELKCQVRNAIFRKRIK